MKIRNKLSIYLEEKDRFSCAAKSKEGLTTVVYRDSDLLLVYDH